MTRTPCPLRAELLSLVDNDLVPERAERQRAHIAACADCRDEEARLRAVVADLRAPFDPPSFDARAHAAAVMARLDQPAMRTARPRAASLWAGAGSLAAGVVLVVYLAVNRAPDPASGTWQARGGSATSSIAREVGVWPCAIESAPRRLGPGAAIGPRTPLSALFRNAGDAPAFLLLFAVDVRGEVHWISPAYERADADPAATVLAVGADERLLPTTAVLAGVPPGPLRIVAVIARAGRDGRAPARVSDVERLAQPLDAPALAARFPGAQVRETQVEVQGPASEARP